MTVRSRRHLSPAAHWVTLVIGLAVLLDVLWIGSRLQPQAHAAGALGPAQAVAAEVARSGPPSLHMHQVF